MRPSELLRNHVRSNTCRETMSIVSKGTCCQGITAATSRVAARGAIGARTKLHFRALLHHQHQTTLLGCRARHQHGICPGTAPPRLESTAPTEACAVTVQPAPATTAILVSHLQTTIITTATITTLATETKVHRRGSTDAPRLSRYAHFLINCRNRRKQRIESPK